MYKPCHCIVCSLSCRIESFALFSSCAHLFLYQRTQGLLRAKLIKELHEEELARRRAENDLHAQRHADPVMAALIIQRVYRGYAVRKRVKDEAAAEMMFVGMAPRQLEDVNAKVRELAIRQLRKTRQIDNATQYKQALEDLKKVVADTEGPDIKDKFRDARFQWWLKEKEEKGKMHDDFKEFYKGGGGDGEDSGDEGEGKPEKGDKKKKGDKKGGKKEKKEKKGKKGGKKVGKKGKKDDDGAGEAAQLLSTLLIGPSGIITDMTKAVGTYKNGMQCLFVCALHSLGRVRVCMRVLCRQWHLSRCCLHSIR